MTLATGHKRPTLADDSAFLGAGLATRVVLSGRVLQVGLLGLKAGEEGADAEPVLVVGGGVGQ
jgi:hypothetical protein